MNLRVNKLVPGIDYKSFLKIVLPNSNNALAKQALEREVKFTASNIANMNKAVALFFLAEIKYFRYIETKILQSNLYYCDDLFGLIYPKKQHDIILKQQIREAPIHQQIFLWFIQPNQPRKSVIDFSLLLFWPGMCVDVI